MAGMDMGGDKKDMDMSKMDIKKEVVIDKSKIPTKFKQQLGGVVSSYLLLKDKLTKDNASIKSDVEAIQKALKRVDMTLLLGDAHNVWMKSLNEMNKDLKSLSKAVNIEEQRNQFLTLSQSLSDVTQKLGVKMKNDQPLYLEFCPMANENNGGYWLSTEKKIKNPYFGAKMLKCGKVKQEIK